MNQRHSTAATAVIARLEGIGLDVTTLKVQLHRKLAYPLVSLVMTLIGIPFSFVVDDKGTIRGSYRSFRPECLGKLEQDIRTSIEARKR